MSGTATLDNIKTLRSSLDAPYKDCVEALKENDNDIAKATKWLKEKGKGDQRVAKAECGAIGMYEELGNGASLIVVRCETDFVAINKDFIRLIDQLAKDLFLGVADAVDKFKESAWTFKENIEIGAHLSVKPNEGERTAVYLHHNRSRASIIRFTGSGSERDAQRIATQVCAMSPTCVRREDVEQSQIDEIVQKAKDDAISQGKPEAIAEKIAVGKVNSALKDFVLLEQPLFDEPKTTVGDFAEKAGINVLRFTNVLV